MKRQREAKRSQLKASTAPVNSVDTNLYQQASVLLSDKPGLDTNALPPGTSHPAKGLGTHTVALWLVAFENNFLLTLHRFKISVKTSRGEAGCPSCILPHTSLPLLEQNQSFPPPSPPTQLNQLSLLLQTKQRSQNIYT